MAEHEVVVVGGGAGGQLARLGAQAVQLDAVLRLRLQQVELDLRARRVLCSTLYLP